MIPTMTVGVDLTRSEDELNLKPGYAVRDCDTSNTVDSAHPVVRYPPSPCTSTVQVREVNNQTGTPCPGKTVLVRNTQVLGHRLHLAFMGTRGNGKPGRQQS